MRKFVYVILFLFIFSFLALPFSYCASEDFMWSSQDTPSVVTTSTSVTSTTNLDLESGSAILIEQNSGMILYEKNPHEKLRPASVTKVMTILLIMEALDSGKITLTDKIPCTENAASMGGSQIWLDVREELTVDEMLKAICVTSANDYDVQK